MSCVSTERTITVVRYMFASYVLLIQGVSDNCPQFASAEFNNFMHRNGVKHIRYAPYHPSSNGGVERFVQTFKTAMKAARN